MRVVDYLLCALLTCRYAQLSSHIGAGRPTCWPAHIDRSLASKRRNKAIAPYGPHNANTYSTTALRCSRSSGVLTSLPLAAGLGPETIATYCLPLASNVIGGAEKPEARVILHN